MSDMEKAGYVEKGEVHKLILDVIEYTKEQEPNIINMYKTGKRVLLTNKGLLLTDRKEIGELRKKNNTYTIIEVLTVEELYRFIMEYYTYIKQGQSSAVIQIMEYRLREFMDDVYEDNYELVFKDLVLEVN